jgi:hypothetical protein
VLGNFIAALDAEVDTGQYEQDAVSRRRAVMNTAVRRAEVNPGLSPVLWREFGRQSVIRRSSTIQLVGPAAGRSGTYPDQLGSDRRFMLPASLS